MAKRPRSKPLRLGFVPENDCAAALIARELGYFAEVGLSVELHRESSCAGIRDNLIHGRCDAAIAPATLPYVMSLGLDFERCNCVSGLVVSLQGNGLSVSQRLWEGGVRDASTLRDQVFKEWGKHTFTFGVVYPYAPGYFLLTQWLRSARLVPHSHVRIVVMPAEQMYPTMQLGYLDGFCVGEPWTSVAVQAGQAVCLASSVQLAPLHPEKVLMVRESFASQRAEEHERLIAALVEAGRYCEQPENRSVVCNLLAKSPYVNAPVDCIRPGIGGPFPAGGKRLQSLRGLNVFAAHQASEPCSKKAAWVMDRLWDYLHLKRLTRRANRPQDSIFRPDIYQRALRRVGRHRRLPVVGEMPSCALG